MQYIQKQPHLLQVFFISLNRNDDIRSHRTRFLGSKYTQKMRLQGCKCCSPTPAGGENSSPLNPLAGFEVPLRGGGKRRERGGNETKEREGTEENTPFLPPRDKFLVSVLVTAGTVISLHLKLCIP